MAAELADFGTAVKELTEMFGGIKKSLDNLDRPAGVDQVHMDRNRGVMSYMYEDETPAQVLRGVPLRKSHGITRDFMPENYKPGLLYKSFGQQINEMAINPGGFRDKYQRFHTDIRKTVQGMSEGIGSDGGFVVLPEFSQKIFEKTYENSLWEMTDNYQVAGNSMTFPRLNETSRKDGFRAGGLLGYWVDEGAGITATKPSMGQLSLKLKKVAVVVYLTEELIQDAGMALEGYVNRKVGEEFKFQVGNSLINGKGTGNPQGILNSNALLSIAKESGQAAATIVTQNIAKMWSRLYAGSRNNSAWFINQDTEPQLNLMTLGVGTGGVVTYMPPGGLSASPYGSIYGRPVVPLEFCSTLGTQGDIILADWKQYVTISKGGIAQAQSIHVEFLTDQTALRFIMRVDGQTWENAPVTPYNGTNTQSSFVVLANR